MSEKMSDTKTDSKKPSNKLQSSNLNNVRTPTGKASDTTSAAAIVNNNITNNNLTKIAVIRVRGNVGIDYRIKSTLTMLNLHNQHFCSVITATPSLLGMVKRAKDYITWGEIDAETFSLLNEKRGKTKEGAKDNKFYRLNSPRKGFERKGIKRPYSVGGALGYRADKINDLIKRMI